MTLAGAVAAFLIWVLVLYALDSFVWLTFTCLKCNTRFYQRRFIVGLCSCEQCGYGNWANHLFDWIFKAIGVR